MTQAALMEQIPGRLTEPRYAQTFTYTQRIEHRWGRAACRDAGSDRELFDEDAPAHSHRLAALRYCAGCPLAAVCLDAARASGLSGVYGGQLLFYGRVVDEGPCPCVTCCALRWCSPDGGITDYLASVSAFCGRVGAAS